jgi:hypothetical protein
MKRIAVLFLSAAFLFASGSPGIRPRAGAADYPVHESTEDATVAAAVIPPGDVKKIVGADLNSAGYVLVEVGVFPAAGKEVDLAPDDFTLVIDANSISERPADAEAVAAVAGKKQAPPRVTSPDDVYTSAGVSIGRETYPDPVTGRTTSRTVTGVGGGVGVGGPPPIPCQSVYCDDRAPLPAPPPVSSSTRNQIEQELWQKSLPDGKTLKPVAGYLYFPKPSGKAKNAAWVLRWDNAGKRVKLALENPSKR